ncbi:TatD family hydrolase [Candidatus Saccharibacteria bacterium]|nr:TatD family hydrolase [Candidatus Saccharibacteria bacterium]
MLIDTHCHLHDREFFTAEQAEEMLKRAHEKGVEKIICIGTSHEDSLRAAEFASEHKDVYWTYGVHPEYCKEGFEYNFSGSPVAIGEVGLDYHYEEYDREAQIRLFEEMLQLASDNNLPVSFHVREAFEDFFAVISNFPKIRGVVHSFSDNKKNLKRILTETDFYVGVNGMATYSTLPTPPLERILLETDAPFLTPVPFRGIINECGYIYEIAQWLSDKLAVDFDQIERETTRNAEKLFKFGCTGVQEKRND